MKELSDERGWKKKSSKKDPAVQKSETKSIFIASDFLLVVFTAARESYQFKTCAPFKLRLSSTGQKFLEKFKHKAAQSYRRINPC